MFSASKYNPFQAVPVALSRAQRLVRFFNKDDGSARPATRRFNRHTAAAMLTDLDFRRAIEQFRVTHHSAASTDDLVIAWRVIRGLTPAEFQRGCRRYAEDGKNFMPTPSDIKRFAAPKRPTNRANHPYPEFLDQEDGTPWHESPRYFRAWREG